MEQETELLKIQAFLDYLNSNYNTVVTYLLGFAVAYYVTILGLNIQGVLGSTLNYFVFLVTPLPFLGFFIYRERKSHLKELEKIDELIKKVNNLEPLPSIKEMFGRAYWTRDKG